MSLSDRIKQRLREGDGLTQAGLSRACCVARSSVNAWVNGRVSHLLGENLLLAAEYLGVTPEWLSGSDTSFAKIDGAIGGGSNMEDINAYSADTLAKITVQQALLVLQKEISKQSEHENDRWPFRNIRFDEWAALDSDSRKAIEGVVGVMVRQHSAALQPND